jgi:SAM-dependent methyltransferase
MSAEKYSALAERWSELAYADPAGYYARRAELVVGLGPTLAAGDAILELACGDGGLAEFLLPYGLEYFGVDVSPAMVDVARQRLGARGRVELGDVNDFTGPQQVAATTFFRALYYVRDRRSFFRRVGGITEKKLVFDLNPRRHSLAQVRAELADAGWTRFDTRPFFVPTTVALPRSVQALLRAAESVRGVSDLLLQYRFTYICAAFRRRER